MFTGHPLPSNAQQDRQHIDAGHQVCQHCTNTVSQCASQLKPLLLRHWTHCPPPVCVATQHMLTSASSVLPGSEPTPASPLQHNDDLPPTHTACAALPVFPAGLARNSHVRHNPLPALLAPATLARSLHAALYHQPRCAQVQQGTHCCVFYLWLRTHLRMPPAERVKRTPSQVRPSKLECLHERPALAWLPVSTFVK